MLVHIYLGTVPMYLSSHIKPLSSKKIGKIFGYINYIS